MDMPETPQRNYQSIADMAQDTGTVSWKKFFVILAGRTNDAHLEFVAKLKSIRHTEVNSAGESDYLLVFCPVASRVGTDVSEALDKLPGGKPAILVVMHHTFKPDHVLAESRRLVDNPNVELTVDCLFYNNKLLKSNRNEIAWFDVQKYLGVSTISPCYSSRLSYCQWLIVFLVILFLLLLLLLTVIFGTVFDVKRNTTNHNNTVDVFGGTK